MRELEQALRTVPFLHTLGVVVESAEPGDVAVRLPKTLAVTDTRGGVHSAALFAIGELAAGIAVGTHPRLGGLIHLQKASRIRYLVSCDTDATVAASLSEDLLGHLEMQLAHGGKGQLEIGVAIRDAAATVVAELVVLFAFRR